MTTEHLQSRRTEAGDGVCFHGVFRSPCLEDAFRRWYLADDIAVAGACLTVVVLGGVIYNLIDYRLFSPNWQFYLLLEVRLLGFLVALMSWQALRRCTAPATFDRLVFQLCLLLAVSGLYVSATRPPGHVGHVIVTVMVVALSYSIVPLPLLLQILWAGLFSIGYLACMPDHGASNGKLTVTTSIAISFAVANLLGVATSWQLQRRRRLAFAAALRETELRRQLEQALADVQTLRGYLSICAWCKRVRDEDDGWQNVEAFVQDRTHAQFTHGICPICFQKHFGAVTGTAETPASGAN